MRVECDIMTMMSGAYKTACLMRGNVPEWDSTYVEKYVPADVLAQMKETSMWVDNDGFWWGFSYVFAGRVKASMEPVAVLASKHVGQGHVIQKAVGIHGVVKEYSSEELLF
jgi:hypothetical protein